MRSQIDLKRMRYILEVARAEAITTAAQTLAISQPALTRNIAEVEAELGIQIFYRLPRGIELTEEGKKFVARAKQILGDVDSMVEELKQEKGLPTGRLKVGLTPSGYVDYVRPTVRQLAKQYPGVSIELHAGSAQAICPRLLHGELNVVVGSSSYLERWRELEVSKLKVMRFACMVRKDHPISQIRKPAETDVLQYPAIMPASVEPMYSDIAQRYVANDLLPFQPRYVTDDFTLAMQLVNETDAYYPLQSVEEGIEDLGKRYLMLRDIVPLPLHYISIAWSPHRPKTALAGWFEEHLRKRLA